MPKVHPNAVAATSERKEKSRSKESTTKQVVSDCQVKPRSNGDQQVLTVWKKSLMFNCNGFTVFDGKGNLVFRVDNYCSSNKAEILLMDATGKPLLTIRRKRLSLVDNWVAFEGETDANPKFLMKKKNQVNFMNSKSLAQVIGPNKNLMYEIEGSYIQRCCTVYDNEKRIVGEIKRKEALAGGAVSFGVDVFRLVVQPELDPTVAMALVILLDQMFGSR